MPIIIAIFAIIIAKHIWIHISALGWDKRLMTSKSQSYGDTALEGTDTITSPASHHQSLVKINEEEAQGLNQVLIQI
jgi:hypothetical protein